MAETKPLARQIFDFSTQADARIDAKRNVAGGICGLDSDGKVSSVQFAAEAQRNVAGGVCGLDSDGKIATAQLPAAALGGLNYRGTWNANTNSPAVVSATGTAGHYYKVSVAGVTTIDGENDWSVGDWIIFSGSTWQKVDNTDKVSSVNGYIGAVSLTKSDLSLGNVENTALSTWTGTTQVATLGTVLTGVWSATAIAIAKGGTGATSASDARENLGLGTMARAAVEDYLSAANNLSNLASASTARTNLGLGTMAVAAASSYLAVASNLSDLASASTARTNLGLGTIATAAASSYLAAANNLSDLTSATAARTTLGLGSAALNAAGDFAAASHTHAAADVVSGVIAVARLGTGMPTSNTYLRGDGVWATGDGAGDIVGPSSAVNLRVVVFNGTTGKLVSDGGSTVGNLLDRANHTGTQAWGTLTGTPTTISGYGITDFNSLGDARYLKLSNSAVTIGSTAVSLGETAATVAGLTLTSPTINGGTNAAITSLGIRSTGSAFDLTLATAEVLTAGRTLSFVLGDSARTITLAGNATISGTNSGDQTSVSGNAGTATALQTARTIAMTGDVAWSINSFDGTGNVTAVGTIAAGVVTLAKMASMATASILGRNTDNTGSPEVLSASTTKSLLSLNNVENTAVSTWAGTSNITTLGTIVTGVWHGTAVADSYVASASTWNAKQAGDATLTALSALTIAEDSLTIGTGADAFSQTAFAANTFPAKASTGGLAAKAITNFGLSLVDDADESTARTTLGLVIGTNVQAYDTELAALASVTSAADKVPYFTGSGTATVSTLTAFGRTLIDDADAAAGLLTLGAAALNSPAFTGTPTAPTAIGGTNTTQIATTAFVGSAVSLAVTGLLELKGSTNCSTNPNYPAGSVGDTYYVTVAGKIGGASGAAVDIGDTYICQTDNAGGTQSAVGASWFILEHNLVGALLSANNLSDLASASSARTNLGLGTLATQSGTFSGTSSNTNTGDVTLAGENYLTISAQVITAAAVNLSGTHVTGTLADARFPATLPALSGVNLTALNATNLASGTLSAARMPALTGDVTTVAGAVATTLANSAVSLAKMADVATASVFYRKAAGTGAPEVNTLATLKTDLGLTGTNSGDQTTIVGITGTKAQFDTAVSDGNILYVGDAVTSVTGTAPVVSSGGTTPAISIPAATASVAGHMTAAAMSKLDGIATGANLYVHPNHSGVVTSTADGATAIADAALSIAKTSGLQSALDAKQPLDAALTALAAGSDFVQFTGPTTSTKVFTLPDASSTLLFSGGALGTPSGGTLTNCTFPTLNQSTTGSAATLTNGRTLALTGDVTWISPSFNGSANVTAAATVVNLPTGVTQAGSLLVTAIAAPATPAAGKASFYVDSTSKTFAVKNDAGTVSHGIQTKASVANSFVTAISDAGLVTVAQPAFTNVSGSVAASQMPALTGDVTTVAGAVATTIGALKVTNAMLEGSIAYSKLTLTGEVLNADLAGSIAASNLVGTDIDTVGTLVAGAIPTTLLTGTITNAQLDGSIDLTAKVTGILPIANGGTNASTEAGARTALGLGTIATAAATDYLPLVGGTATTFVDPVGVTRAAMRSRNYTFTGALVQSTNIGLAEVTTVSGGGSAYYGRFHWHTVPVTSSANHTSILAELIQTNHYGTGTVSSLYSLNCSTVQQAGAGAVTSLYGAIFSAYTLAASGVTNQWGLHIGSNRGAAGTTTDRRAINIIALTNSGTITDTYGIYIGSQTAGTQTNLPFSIYSSDAGAKMYHAGNVGIGTTSPGTKLDMTGTLRTTGIGNALSGAGAEIAYNGSVGYFITYNRSLGATYSCHFGGDGATGIRVDTVGNVGIGIVIPTSKLHVVGDSNLGGFIVSSAGLLTAGTVPAARVTGLTNLEAIYNSMMN